MKTLLFSMLFVLTGATALAQVKVKTENASVKFKFPAEKVSGTLSGFVADITFDPNNLSASSMSGSVKVATISTGIEKRDEHLKSAEYFNAAKFPTITFKSTSITEKDGKYKMDGKLKIKNVEKDVTFLFLVENENIVGRTTVYIQDFGMMDKKDREETKTMVQITVPISK